MEEINSSWVCPVCGIEETPSGPLVSDWALACHIAGKARSGDKLHRSWARNQSPNIDFKASLPKIAEFLVLPVRKSQQEIEHQYSDDNKAYGLIANIEKRLHGFIKDTLKQELGDSEKEWWVKGIPLKIRQKCVNRREEDGLNDDHYNYTDITDLMQILDNNWGLFLPRFKGVDKRDFLNSLNTLNTIRRTIMHPIRGISGQIQDIKFLEKLNKDIMNFTNN